MSADTAEGAALRARAAGGENLLARHVAAVKEAWRRHAHAMTWEQKIAAIERMRERQAAIRRARRG